MLLDWVIAHAVRLASSAHSRVASTTERLVGARPARAPASNIIGGIVSRRAFASRLFELSSGNAPEQPLPCNPSRQIVQRGSGKKVRDGKAHQSAHSPVQVET